MRQGSRALLVAVIVLSAILATAGSAFAAPRLGVGVGLESAPHPYQGLCTNCHTFAVWPPPTITAGVAPGHGDRSGDCAGCHTVLPAPITPRIPPTYLKGGTRYDTAIQVSLKMYPNGAPAVVLATGVNFPDALCAAPLAKAVGGPILLVAPGSSLASNVLAEITRLHPADIYIVGSASAVSAGIETQVSGLSWTPTVTRIAGPNRFATAAAVADVIKAKLGTTSKVVIANGTNYPDALAAAPLAAKMGWPIMLVQMSAVPSDTAACISRIGATSSLIAGGTGAVSAGVEAEVPAPLRKGGSDRYQTCAALVDYSVAQGMNYSYMALTVGDNFPDALAAGPLLAQQNGVLMLTPPTGVPSPISSRVTSNKAAIQTFAVIGGAVQPGCINAMNGFIR